MCVCVCGVGCGGGIISTGPDEDNVGRTTSADTGREGVRHVVGRTTPADPGGGTP